MLLALCVVVLAAWLTTHLVLVVACVRTGSLSTRDRWLSLVPFLNLWVAWRAGRHRTAIGWACLFVLYVVLRLALGAR